MSFNGSPAALLDSGLVDICNGLPCFAELEQMLKYYLFQHAKLVTGWTSEHYT